MTLRATVAAPFVLAVALASSLARAQEPAPIPPTSPSPAAAAPEVPAPPPAAAPPPQVSTVSPAAEGGRAEARGVTVPEGPRLPAVLFAHVEVPVGHAAPPTEAATRGEGPLRVGLEVFGQYALRNTTGTDGNTTFFHAFDLPRAHAAIEAEHAGAKGRVVLEATRSAAEGSLIGVTGDSLVLRVREAYAAYKAFGMLDVSAGVVPTLTVPNLDGTWMMRPVAPSVLEASGLLSPADLGGRARLEIPKGYGWLAVAAYNGEGYTSRELNRGKNIEGALEVHPLPGTALAPLGVFASFTGGSTGTVRARANRLVGGLVWQGSRVRAGAIVAHAWGLRDLGTARALVLSAFVRVEPVDRLYLAARFDHVARDLEGAPSSSVSTVLGSVGYRIASPLEAFVAVSRNVPTRRAEDELPGSDFWDLRVVSRVVF